MMPDLGLKLKGVPLALIFILLIFVHVTAGSAAVQLIKPHSADQAYYSGDRQHVTVNERIPQPLRIKAFINDSIPLSGATVRFRLIDRPQDTKVEAKDTYTAKTNHLGEAKQFVMIGAKPGVYLYSAEVVSDTLQSNTLYFRLYGRSSRWVSYLLMGLVGGLALFLFGLDLLSSGLRQTAGQNLRTLLENLTRNRLTAVAAGTIVTVIVQSSSATTVMLISLVQANLMTFAQSLGIILGADIGTTITAQLIAFKLTDYALLMVGIGFVLKFFSKRKNYKYIGQSILGFGMLFYGMHVMSESMAPLQTYEPFLSILLQLENPWLGLLVGTIFTALIQSSSAFIGIIIVMAGQDLLTLEAGIPLLFGANLGTCITAMLATINTGREARRVALAHVMFKVFGVLLFIAWIPYFANLVRLISPVAEMSSGGAEAFSSVIPRQIANAHTLFNVFLTGIVLPFTKHFGALVLKWLPLHERGEEEPFKIKYLDDSLIRTPTLALGVAKVEVLRMGRKVKTMVEAIATPFLQKTSPDLSDIDKAEEEIDFLEERIRAYLTKISQQNLSDERMEEVFQMLYAVTEFERMADIVAKNLKPLAVKKMETGAEFSKEGEEEIEQYHERTVKQVDRAIEVFKEMNLEKARKMEEKYQKYRLMEMSLRRDHFVRLQEAVPESMASSEIHVELMELLKRISSHATNIARIQFEKRGELLREQMNRREEQ